MAEEYGLIAKRTLESIGDAIRSHLEITDKLIPSDMPAAIRALGSKFATGVIACPTIKAPVIVSGFGFAPKNIVIVPFFEYAFVEHSNAYKRTMLMESKGDCTAQWYFQHSVRQTNSGGMSGTYLFMNQGTSGITLTDDGFEWSVSHFNEAILVGVQYDYYATSRYFAIG